MPAGLYYGIWPIGATWLLLPPNGFYQIQKVLSIVMDTLQECLSEHNSHSARQLIHETGCSECFSLGQVQRVSLRLHPHLESWDRCCRPLLCLVLSSPSHSFEQTLSQGAWLVELSHLQARLFQTLHQRESECEMSSPCLLEPYKSLRFKKCELPELFDSRESTIKLIAHDSYNVEDRNHLLFVYQGLSLRKVVC